MPFFEILGITSVGLVAGASGGLVRGLVGISKHLLTKKNFQPLRFLTFILIAGIIGAMAGSLIIESWALSLLAGYAGADFIEGMYKSKLFHLFPLPKK